MKDILIPLGTAKFWTDLIIMTVGMSIAAAAVYYILVPSSIIVGSITGLSIVITGVMEKVLGITVKLSVVIFLINALLLVLAWLLIGKEFGAKTVYTALLLGPLIEMWEKILPNTVLIEPGQTSLMGDLWLDLCCFVLLLSISQAILFHINASTGGLDILAKIVNKYLHLDIGTSVTIAGACICCTAFAINPPRLVIVGLIGTWINGVVLDYFTASINRRKRVCIVADEHEKIRKFIIERLGRGCSLYDMRGGYTGEDRVEIETLLTQEEFANVMDFIKTEKISSFITASNISEVYGLWSRAKRKKREIPAKS